eukprot:GHVR01184652.1.p1 GENE.GHVR01184652.1~~GHVR01184652.1.p1  ORF type:complete len:137 (-),score=3.03 GHVR01184652.1:5-415(-)
MSIFMAYCYMLPSELNDVELDRHFLTSLYNCLLGLPNNQLCPHLSHLFISVIQHTIFYKTFQQCLKEYAPFYLPDLKWGHTSLELTNIMVGMVSYVNTSDSRLNYPMNQFVLAINPSTTNMVQIDHIHFLIKYTYA